MSDEEREVKIAEAIKAKNIEIKKRKEAEIKAGFLNPFGERTSYAEFLAEVEKSKKSVAEYCKGKIEAEELAWLENEILIFKEAKLWQ